MYTRTHTRTHARSHRHTEGHTNSDDDDDDDLMLLFSTHSVQCNNNKNSENAKACKAFLSMYIHEFRGGGVSNINIICHLLNNIVY